MPEEHESYEETEGQKFKKRPLPDIPVPSLPDIPLPCPSDGGQKEFPRQIRRTGHGSDEIDEEDGD